MKPGLEPGVAAELEVRVTPEMCPHFDGVLVHAVLATWEVVHQMEVAGRKLLVDYLEPHEEGIGAHIHVDHKSPAPIGAVVRVRAEALECRPHRLTARVTAHFDDRLLAEGEFVQIIMPKARLEKLFSRHRDDA